MTDREELNFTLCMALRKVPPAIFRDMGKRRLPGDDLPEKMAAEKILAHLELTGLGAGAQAAVDFIGWAQHAVRAPCPTPSPSTAHPS